MSRAGEAAGEAKSVFWRGPQRLKILARSGGLARERWPVRHGVGRRGVFQPLSTNMHIRPEPTG